MTECYRPKKAHDQGGQTLVRMYVPILSASGLVRFGPVSQVDIMANETSAEARERPAQIAEECQEIANECKKPVVLRCAHSDRHIFYPQPEGLYERYFERPINHS